MDDGDFSKLAVEIDAYVTGLVIATEIKTAEKMTPDGINKVNGCGYRTMTCAGAGVPHAAGAGEEVAWA
ncbi:hypothetical protein CYMTET_37759 [Cymbomonas tetramitiformis]|uniref:Uncharacterized protein n=1 Tax=Cymbomonas tetramitiformis TaxID=36881 RepID=A0AAE0F6C1_9CHLO|nr:hypothetical protein CYMTET_37759 [Cymbomonas tetramitiformis]